jgi:ATP-binding cassette subfamily C protein CydD
VARHLADATRDVADRSIGVLRIAFLSGAVLDFFAALSVALVAVYCGFNLLGLLPFPVPEKLSLAGALFALALAPEFYLPLRRLAAAYHDKQVGEAAMAQLTAAPALQENPPSLAPGAPAIRFDAVTIDYGDARVGPLSAAVAPGGTLALIGPSGSGKSSLIHALLGLAPIGGGRILHGDMPLDPLCLRGHVGWAGQTLALIPGTLADNIRLARPQADDRAVAHAAHQAGLDTMLAARDCDLSLTLDARGSGLSGGERRRVGIARVLLSDAPLWLLDEPTADLDEESARAIRAILKKASMGRTVILATHDPELMAMADTRTVLA